MLYLIGLGIGDEKDISMKGLEAAKECDIVFAEMYTASWQGDLQKLGSMAGKQIQILTREGVEGDFLINLARKQKVALLVPGDPLSATTHFQLFEDAKKEGIKCRIIHSSSIFTAVAITGLQLYKFGRVTTLPKDFKAQSPLDVVKANKKAGLHSLVLLDIGMDLSKGLEIIEKEYPHGNIVVCVSLGSENESIICGQTVKIKTRIKNINTTEANERRSATLGSLPSCLIIPGELNFKEEEALELWK